MNNQNRTRHFVALSGIFLIALGYFPSPMIAAPNQDKKIPSKTPKGYAPVFLQTNPGQCYSIRNNFEAGKDIPHFSGRLLSIDGKDLSGLSAKEVAQALTGMPGSKIELEIFDDSSKKRKLIFQRVTLRLIDPNDTSEQQINNFVRQLDGGAEGDSRPYELQQANQCLEENLDLFVKAYNALAVQRALHLPIYDCGQVYESANVAFVNSAKIADLDKEDIYLKLALKTNKPFIGARLASDWESQHLFLTNLILTGKINEYNLVREKIIQEITTNNENNDRGDLLREKAVIQKQYAEFLVHNHFKDAVPIIRKLAIEAKKQSPYYLFGGNEEFGDLLEKAGDLSGALDYYLNLDPLKKLNIQPLGMPTLDSLQKNVRNAYRLAEIQNKAGYRAEAILTLEKIIAVLNKRVDPDEEKIAEQIAQYSPTRKDIESALDKLRSAQKNTEVLITQVKQRAGQSDEEAKYATIRIALKAAKSKDRLTIRNAINKLLAFYREEDLRRLQRLQGMNLFSGLINLARRLTDYGLIQESNYLLSNLQIIAPLVENKPESFKFLVAEEIYNNNVLHPSVKNYAEGIQNLFHFSPILPPAARDLLVGNKTYKLKLSSIENLRSLAVIYQAAGENARAQFLLHLANKSLSNGSAKIPNEALPLKVSILLDESVLCAEEGKFQNADISARLALKLFQEADNFNSSPENNYWHQTLENKILRLNSLLVDAGLCTVGADLINFAISKLSPQIACSKLREGLAEALYKDQKFLEAQKNLEQVLQIANPNEQRFSTKLLAARIYQATEHYELAAHYFSDAEKLSQSYLIALNNQLQKQNSKALLKNAVYCAEQAQNFNKLDLANYYMRLGNASGENQDALEDYENALALVPDLDKDKIGLVNTITILRNKLEQQSLATTQKLTKEEELRRDIESAKAAIKPSHLRAILAEKTGNENASIYWFRLAQNEATAGFTKLALEHVQHGLSKFQRTGEAVDYSPCLNVHHALFSLNKGEDFSYLLKEATRRVAEEYGELSAATAIQRAQEVVRDSSSLRDAEALHGMDSILKAGPRIFEVGRYSASAEDAIQNCISKAAREKRFTFSLAMLEKVLAAQQKNLEKDDERIANTLIFRANIREIAGLKSEAAADFKRAYDIKKLYTGELHAAEQCSFDESQALNSPYTLTGFQERKAKKIPFDYIDPNSSANRNLEESLPSNEKIAALSKELQVAQIQAKYSERTMNALDHLIDLEKSEKNWARVAELCKQRLDIYERKPDRNADRMMGCTPPNFRRMRCCEDALESLRNIGQLTEAKRILDRASKNFAEPSSFENIRLGKLELQYGNKAKAIAFAEKAQAQQTTHDWWFRDLAEFWYELGYPERCANIYRKMEEIESADKARHAADLASPFYNTGIHAN